MTSSTPMAELKQRLNENPHDLEAAVELGNYYFDKLNPPTAIMYYQIALNINPNLPTVLTDMGTMFWRNQDPGLAELVFKRAIQIAPDFGNAYVNLGLLSQYARDDLKQARSYWQTLVDNYPDHPAANKARELLVQTQGVGKHN